jgi:hypothetical protein
MIAHRGDWDHVRRGVAGCLLPPGARRDRAGAHPGVGGAYGPFEERPVDLLHQRLRSGGRVWETAARVGAPMVCLCKMSGQDGLPARLLVVQTGARRAASQALALCA